MESREPSSSVTKLNSINEPNAWDDFLSRSQFYFEHAFSFFPSNVSGLSLVPPATGIDEHALQRESVTRGRRKATVPAPTALAATQHLAGSALDQGGSGTYATSGLKRTIFLDHCFFFHLLWHKKSYFSEVFV